MLRKLPFNIIQGQTNKREGGNLGGVAFTLAAKTELTLTPDSLEDMAHDLILGHNRCFFAYSGRVHPTHKKSA